MSVATTPRYVAIAGTLLEEIKAGRFPLSSKLPSESALMRRFGCSRNTVRSAIAHLSRIGVITTRRGSGSYVTKQAGIIHSLSSLRSISEVILGLGYTPAMTKVTLRLDPNPRPDIHEFLGGGSIWRLRRVTTASGTPFSINDSWFSDDIAATLDLRSFVKGGSLYRQFARVVGRPAAEALDYIGAEIASAAEARLLDIDPGAPLLAILRYAHDVNGEPLEVARSAARADMYHYLVRLTREVRTDE
ncbi:MAG: GntR family transcriptional regulator [Arachnia sp.]